MMDEQMRSLPWTAIPVTFSLVVCFLLVSAMAACSKKNVSSTTAQIEPRPTQDRPAPVGSRGPAQAAPAPAAPEGPEGVYP
jgi:hypothetical protein